FRPDQTRAARFRNEHDELLDRPIILYPGTLGKINKVGWLVPLAAKLQTFASECCIVIIGAGAEWDDVKELASAQGVLDKNFFMYPQIPKQKLVEAFCAASVIVSLFIDLPEMKENSANKFFDALASGTAIALNYEGWQAELIQKYKTELILSRDINNAAKALIDFLGDKENVIRCGNNGRNLAISHFSRDDLAKNLEEVLADAIR
ncbi:MAG: glycosyltransferase, partial [Candidatus Electrothrix sp. ATG2]|nr:glycosyltransferase [Candidatus Electrothrix sp. ATG2]